MSGRRRVGVTLLVACAIFFILVGLFLTGRFPQEPLRRAIESRLQRGLGAGSSVGSVRIVPGRLQFELRDLVLVGPTYKLVLPRAFVVAKLDFVLGRSLAFRVVQAESPHLTLRPSPTAQPEKPLLSQPLVIDHIEMTGGVIEYEGTADVGELALRGVDARGSVGHGTLELALDGGTLRRGAPLELGARPRPRCASRPTWTSPSTPGHEDRALDAHTSGPAGRPGHDGARPSDRRRSSTCATCERSGRSRPGRPDERQGPPEVADRFTSTRTSRAGCASTARPTGTLRNVKHGVDRRRPVAARTCTPAPGRPADVVAAGGDRAAGACASAASTSSACGARADMDAPVNGQRQGHGAGGAKRTCAAQSVDGHDSAGRRRRSRRPGRRGSRAAQTSALRLGASSTARGRPAAGAADSPPAAWQAPLRRVGPRSMGRHDGHGGGAGAAAVRRPARYATTRSARRPGHGTGGGAVRAALQRAARWCAAWTATVTSIDLARPARRAGPVDARRTRGDPGKRSRAAARSSLGGLVESGRWTWATRTALRRAQRPWPT